MLLDQDAALRAAELVDDSMFYREGHRRLFRAMVALTERRIVIDHITLRDELLRRGELETAGGLDYLAELVDAVPTAANLEFHAKIVRDKAILRRLIETSTVDHHRSLRRPLHRERAARRRRVADLPDLPAAGRRRLHPDQGDAVADDGAHRNAPAQRQGDYRCAQRLRRLGRDDLGVPGVGADHRRGAPVHGQDGLLSQHRHPRGGRRARASPSSRWKCPRSRWCSACSAPRPGWTASAVRQGTLRDSDFTRLARAAGILQSCPIWIDDTPSITLLEMRSKARRLKIENDVRLIVVDYLQLMRSPEYSENRVQEISDISRSLKALARELDIPVIALSQLSRASEQRGGERKPILSDLRDSGAIEQDADLVIFIHRPECYQNGRQRGQQSRRASPRSSSASTATGRPATWISTSTSEFTRFDNRTEPRGAGVAWPERGRSTAAPSAATSTQVGGPLRGVRGVEHGGGGAGGARQRGGRAAGRKGGTRPLVRRSARVRLRDVAAESTRALAHRASPSSTSCSAAASCPAR